ncbi:trifunctional serine/threonine-protein kinase/ATP-binding protein/sensor histidine kinase [Bradyrhizobium liaoningense]
MTTGRNLSEDASTPPVPDKAILDRALSILIRRDGEVARLRVTDPASGTSWIAFRTSWTSDYGCRRLAQEFALRDRLDPAWALRASAFLRTSEGPALLFRDSGATPIESLGADRVPISHFLKIAIGATHALALAHEQRLLHRDITPWNLVREDDGSIRLVSFGLSGVLDSTDRMSIAAARDRSLAYAAPEEMRHEDAYADERSDLYSLGITLFEVLTGTLPLMAETTAEWLHAHIAVEPRPPSAYRADVPEMLDALILKLVAKDPQDRYQSASTLEADLRRCSREWTAGSAISQFELGRIDRLRRLASNPGLFGRDVELRGLADSYMRVAGTGDAEIALLAGPAGAGKTALVRELALTVRRMSASFASGKPDQYQPATPYAPVVQAVRSLIMGVLGGKRSELETKRAVVLEQVGGHAPLIAHLVPDLELVIGPQTASNEVSVGQVPLRVNRALVAFFQAFAADGAPLLLFIDDLQWADDATLELIEMIVAERPKNLFLVGAYRSGESSRTGRFNRFLSGVTGHSSIISSISLSPLMISDVDRFIAATLDEREQPLDELALIVHEKTGGNPFYVTQLMRALVDERAVQYNDELQRWTWNAVAVGGHQQTDNVVDLLILRFGRLPPGTREALRLLACIGAGANDILLARVASVDVEELRRRLEPAEKSGLVVRHDGILAFSHDRVQEAAYELTPAAERATRHAAIAFAMFDVWQGRLQDSVFEIASQIELSVGTPLDLGRAVQFVEGLIAAAERASVAAARTQALSYLAAANQLLGADRWTAHYSLARRIAVLRAECLLATADLDAALVEINGLFHKMETDFDKAEAHRLKAALQTVRSDFRGATATALSGLRLLGVDLPSQPSNEQLAAAYEAVKQGLKGRSIANIVDLPLASDPRIEAAMALLTALEATMFFPSGGLMFLHLAVMVQLTLEHGVTPASVQGLSWLGVSLAGTYDEPSEGLAYAEVALALVDRHGYERYRTATLVALDQVSVWTRPLSYAIGRAREAKVAGNASAELRWLCYSCNHIVSDLLVMGEELFLVQEELEPLLEIARGAGYEDIVDLVSTQFEFVKSLRQGAVTPVGTWELAYGSDSAISSFGKQPMSALFFWTYLLRGECFFLYGDLAKAATCLAKAGELAWSVPAHINLSDYRLYAALTVTQSNGNMVEHSQTLGSVAEHRERFKAWAELNPGTFRNKLALIDAELARLRGDDLAAMKFYEQSASAAASEGFVHEQALAHELASRHARSVGLESISAHHARLAYSSYRRWGADGKLRQLEAQFSFLLTESRGSFGQVFHGQEHLDLSVAMRTAQALSEEIALEQLIKALMKSMIVHAGAQYGVLLLMRNDEARIEATGRVIDDNVIVDVGVATPTDDHVPLSILHTVVRTRKSASFGNANSQALPQHAASLALHPARSLLCLPFLRQGVLVGVLYLENNLAQDVFTPGKIAMLEVLAPQAANSLEAARLYAELIGENARRQETEAALRSARSDLARTSHLTVMGELAASIAHEINQPLSAILSSVGASLRWLKADQPDLKEVLLTLENIRNAGQRAADIVRALRALAKQEPATLVSVIVDDLIREILMLTSPDIEKRGVRLTARLESAGAQVVADRTQLQQVVLNLVTNALDAMAVVETPRELLVTSRVGENSVIVSVQDTGNGIPEEIRSRIFDPFFTTKSSGMGMGLSICRSIMEAHGGTLDAVATPEGGSSFVFKLPVAAGPD